MEDMEHLRQLAYNLVLDIYPLLDEFPDEAHHLGVRVRECAISLPLSFAPGSLVHAGRSVRELKFLLRLSTDLGFLPLDVHAFLKKKLAELEECLS